MTDSDLQNIINHKTVYLPWRDGLGYPDGPVAFTRGVAEELGLPVTVVCATVGNVPEALKGAGYVTERSMRDNRVRSVVLLYYPSPKLMDRVPLTNPDITVAAEWQDEPLTTWAAKRGAWNMGTNAPMILDLSDETRDDYESILWAGNNGWHDAAGKRDAVRILAELAARGALNKEELLGFLTGDKHYEALSRLGKLIDLTLRR